MRVIIIDVFDFGDFPVLHTPRLLLRRIVPDDAEAIFRLRSDEQVTRYNIGKPYERLEQACELISGIQAAYDDKTELRWGITLKSGDGQLIGMCGYNYWHRIDQRASVGYDLARDFWRQGIMAEALRAAIAFGFARMDLHRVDAETDSRNVASIRLLEKLGFRREGARRDYIFDDDWFHDLLLFGLLLPDFELPSYVPWEKIG